MVSFKSFITVAVLSGLASARPHPQDSALGIEVAVSAPNGTPITDSAELASQSSFEAAQATATVAVTDSPAPPAQSTPATYGSDNQYSNGNQYPNGGQWQQPPPNSQTTSAWVSYSTPSYGSGYSNWGGSGYDDCVNQCIASYGAPPASYVPTATVTGGYMGSTGTGATHTVIVAPSAGVLRYVPFAINASVGDTVKFMWGASNHTVTKSSVLTPCNISDDNPFNTGLQPAGFTFTQVVNSTDTTFYYCGNPGHCPKGMFGMINPPYNAGAATSVGSMMQTISQNNSDVSAYAAYVQQQTTGNQVASKWGTNIDMNSIPEWAQVHMLENVLYTRTILAANPDMVQPDGNIDLGSMNNTPLMVPSDVSAILNNAAASSAPASNAAPGSQTPTTNAASSESPVSNAGSAAGDPSGALSLSSSRILVGAAVVFATLFAL